MAPLVTQYSSSTYKIQEPQVIKGTWQGSAVRSELDKLSDGIKTIDIADDTNNDCYFEIQTEKDGHVFVLDEARVFLNNLNDITPFVNRLTLQGSSGDGVYRDIWTLDESVHKGWNSQSFRKDARPPAYKAYRFRGTSRGSCRVGEAQLIGIETLESSSSEVSCTPKAIIDGRTFELNAMAYSRQSTPVLTGMSPAFGSVYGGDSVEFYGTGFSGRARTSVMIDGRPCAVTE